jgi:hypothetical protein
MLHDTNMRGFRTKPFLEQRLIKQFVLKYIEEKFIWRAARDRWKIFEV